MYRFELVLGCCSVSRTESCSLYNILKGLYYLVFFFTSPISLFVITVSYVTIFFLSISSARFGKYFQLATYSCMNYDAGRYRLLNSIKSLGTFGRCRVYWSPASIWGFGNEKWTSIFVSQLCLYLTEFLAYFSSRAARKILIYGSSSSWSKMLNICMYIMHRINSKRFCILNLLARHCAIVIAVSYFCHRISRW